MRFLIAVIALVLMTFAPAYAQMRAPRAAAFPEPAAMMQAQVPVNPTIAEFTPSADHDAMVAGTPVVTKYVLEIYGTGVAPLVTRDLGKPVPVAGLISFAQLATVYATLPAATYTAKVVAEGPGGLARSDSSNPFGVLTAPRASPKPVIR